MSIIFASKISFKLFWFPPSSTPPSHWSCHHLSPANGNFLLNGQVPSSATHPSLYYTQRMVSEYWPDCHRWVRQPDVKVKTTFVDRPALCTILLLLPPWSLLHKAYLCSSHTDFRSSPFPPSVAFPPSEGLSHAHHDGSKALSSLLCLSNST